MKNQNIIIPFCIYHYIDPNTNTYLGYLGDPEKVRLENGEETFRCAQEPRALRRWVNTGMFYAVDPSFRPIPTGMRIFCAKKKSGFPYNTINMEMVYDPFNIKPDCVYFTTYNQPVINTVPLYFHKMGDNIFPSFDEKPPTTDKGWGMTEISPIFVMTKDTVGDIFGMDGNAHKLKFRCVNGRCLPWVNNISNLFESKEEKKLLSLGECVLSCNELVVAGKESSRPEQLLQQVSNMTKRQSVLLTWIEKISPSLIAIIVLMFIMVLSVLFYLMVNRNASVGRRYS